MKRGKLVILLIEDDENDVFFFQRASQKDSVNHTIHAVHDARDAIRYLLGEGRYADRTAYALPNMILSDLKMPGVSGFEFLEWLRTRPEYSVIPVLIFSSSALEADVRTAYELGARSFISKPSGIDELAGLLRTVFDYWSRCECPPPTIAH